MELYFPISIITVCFAVIIMDHSQAAAPVSWTHPSSYHQSIILLSLGY